MGAVPADGAGLADWINAISQLVFIIIFLMLFLGFNQRFQVFIWSRNIRARLGILENMAKEAKARTVEEMTKLATGASERGDKLQDEKMKTPYDKKGDDSASPDDAKKYYEELVDRFIDYFMIQPVDIEPTDIIRRMDILFNTREERMDALLKETLPKTTKYERSLIGTAMEITIALNFVYKIVRHLLLTGQKMNNWILIMQLEMLMPMIMRQATTYRKALDVFLDGKPIGDGIGPLVAHYMAAGSSPREIVKDTLVYKKVIEEREVYIIKASGPESNVGHPGKAVEMLSEELESSGKKIGMIITIDAALKLEGEETGTVAEGVGAAIGDPGPEKIRIERVAAKHGAPLHAVIIKMSMEEAILEMKKEIANKVDNVIARVNNLIKSVPKDHAVIVAGIGNSVGIA